MALPSTDTDIDVQARVWMTAAEAEAALDGDHTIQQEVRQRLFVCAGGVWVTDLFRLH